MKAILLQALPVARFVTAVTEIFEALVGRSPARSARVRVRITLPAVPAGAAVRAIPAAVEMHGCVAHHASIVLTVPLVSMCARGLRRGKNKRRRDRRAEE